MMSGVPRRALGGLILALSTLPIFRVLDAGVEAPFRETNVRVAEATLEFVTWGAVTVILLGVGLAMFLPTQRVRDRLQAAGDHLMAIRLWKLAGGLALVSTTLAITVERLLFRGFFRDVDEMASVLQARYIAAGELAGTLPGLPEAWLIPNMMMVDAGWVSQFPPAHLFTMALAIKMGILHLMGPLLLGAFVALATLVLPRVLVDSPRTARLAALGVALSPFLVFIGAGAMSHTTAGVGGLAALYAALRARDGHAGWSLLAGASIGFMTASRPWIGLILGCVATLGVWAPFWFSRTNGVTPRWFVLRALGTVTGGAPFAAFLAWFNTRIFSSPFTLGYSEAFGERHRLGFHVDPWGYNYTALDALGFTSSDLLSFGIQLLETPIPLGAVLGAWLLASPTLPRGTLLLLAWATAPVVANAVYWFHATRMLYESAPAWLGLATVATVGLTRMEWGAGWRVSPRDVALWSTLVALGAGVCFGLPSRLRGYRWSEDTVARVTMPEIPDSGAALVFVHTSWNERTSSRLQGAGRMRQDTVTTSIRRNTHCELHLYAVARELRLRGSDASVSLPRIDLLQIAGTPEGIERTPAPDGATLRIRRGDPFPAECLTELRADRFGAVALAPLLWQGDLPGVERGRPLFVRDLGPDKNDEIRAFFPDRTPYVFVPKVEGAYPEIVPYEEGMQVLWKGPPRG